MPWCIMMSININSIDILNIDSDDCHGIFNGVSKSYTINLFIKCLFEQKKISLEDIT